MAIDRREFFRKSGLLAATGLLAPMSMNVAATVEAVAPGQKPRHIIHMVCDGMSWGTFTAANRFSEKTRNRILTWAALMRNPAASSGWVDTQSLNSLVTDSSAAASAWGSGSRVVNGAVNQLPDGSRLKPLYTLFREAGWRRGLVTTTEITHATPAGFAACVPSREMPQTIASQYLDQRVEVLLGGGRQFFDPALRTNGQDYFQPFTSAGYSLLKSTADLNSASTGKSWLGLFAKSHMPYVIDLKNNSSTAQKTPSLGLMTRRALENLVNANHFILQVEGGRVDHAAHTCDIPTAIRELIAFDEALDVCLEFQKKNPETLIVLTSDHATGNPGLMGQGYEYEDSTKAFGRIAGVRCSFPEIIKAIGKKRTAEEVAKVISEQTGCKVSVDKAALFIPFLDKQGKTVFGDLNGATTQLGQLMANYLGVSWCGSAHVTDYTPVTAVGPGSERFRGFIAHPDIFHNYTTLAGIDFCNPTWKASIEPLRQSVYEDVAEYALIDDDSAFEQV